MYKVGVLGAGTWGMAVAGIMQSSSFSDGLVWLYLKKLNIFKKTEHIQNYLN